MKRFRLYTYSTDGLQLHEVRWLRAKTILLGIGLGVLLFLLGIEVNQQFDDPVGLGIVRNAGLVSENRALRDQLRFMSGRIDRLQATLADVGDHGNELRLRLNLPRLDEDVLQAGVGGTEEASAVGFSPDVRGLVTDLHRTVSQAERELRLQTESYDEVSRRLETEKLRFARLPAVKPMEGYYTKSFGMRLHPILGIYRPHQGIDIINDVGTPVYATADGTVQFAGRESGLGIIVAINHGYSVSTIYGHLSKTLVRQGQSIRRGQLIALSGNTGLSTGPHLHYEVRVNGVAQNPIDYFFDDVLRVASRR